MIKKKLHVVYPNVPNVHNIAVAVDHFMWLNLVELAVLNDILALKTTYLFRVPFTTQILSNFSQHLPEVHSEEQWACLS